MRIMVLLTTATAFKTAPPSNIARFDTFASARDVLSSSAVSKSNSASFSA